MLCSAKNEGLQRSVVASSATALAPFSQNSAVWRCSGSGSGHAHPWQSNPSTWLSRSRVRAVRVAPIWSRDRFIDTAIAGSPTATSLRSPTWMSFSSMSASGDLRRRVIGP